MRNRHFYILYGFILILCSIQVGILRAEDHTGKAATAGGTRPAAPETLPNDIVQFLQKWVNPSESYLRSQFRITPTLNMGLAAALEKAIAGEEDPVAAIISEFLGQLGEPQLRALKDVPSNAQARTCGQPEPPNSARLDSLIIRMKWAAKRALGIQDTVRPKCVTPEDKFVASFDKFWTETQKYNEKVHALKKKALEGDANALAELKTLVDPGALPGFLQQQATGNGQQGDQVVGDFGKLFFETVNGKQFANLNHGDGAKSARVEFGSDPGKFGAVIRELAADPNVGPLGQFTLSPTAAPGARQIVPRVLGGSGAQPPTTTTTTPPGNGPTPTPTPTGSTTTPPSGGDAAKAKAILVAKCGECHGPNGSRYKNANLPDGKFRISATGELVLKDGSPATGATLSTMLNNVLSRAVTLGDMPDGGLPADEKATLGAWLRSQGAQ